jgi:hypothetical protein
MKKILIVAAALLLPAIAVQRVQAQTTPREVISAAPALPSVAELVAGADRTDAFLDRISALRDDMKATADRMDEQVRAAGEVDADRIARQMTGRSVEQLQGMSESEQMAMAAGLVQQQLSAVGLGSMTLADLQALEGKSDEEIVAAMTAGGVTLGGLTAAAQQNQQAAISQMEATAGMKTITDRWAELDRANREDALAAAEEIDRITARYAPLIAAVPRSDEQKDGLYHNEAEQREVGRLSTAEFTEKYTVWRGVIPAMQARVASKMDDAPRYDQLLAATMAGGGMTGVARTMPTVGFDIADQYLDITAGVTTLPQPEN